MRALLLGLTLLCVLLAPSAHAVDAALVQRIATGDNDEKIAALATIVSAADPKDIPFLQAMAEGTVTLDGKPVEITVNNRLRREIEGAIAVLKLVDPDRATRLAAACSRP